MYTPELALSYINQFDISQDEQYNKLNFYQVAPRPKINYIQEIAHTDRFQQIVDQFFYVFKLEHFNHQYWYGTKEQIIQALSP